MPKKGEKVEGHQNKLRRNITQLEEARNIIIEKDKEIATLKDEIKNWELASLELKKIIDRLKWEDKRKAWVRWRLGVKA
jgi:hypothetical protein